MIRIISLLSAALLGCQMLLPASGLAADRVLVVHSYHSDFSWVRRIDQILADNFNLAGITHKTFYMDTKRNPGEDQKKQAAREATNLLDKFKPDVVIAVDDNAQSYLVKKFVNKSPVQFVFCGVNATPDIYGYPATNVTGILERLYAVETLQALNTILPEVQNVAVISDDSVSAGLIRPRIESVARKLRPGIKIVDYLQPVTFRDWKKAIVQLDKNPAVDALMIPIYHTVRPHGAKTSVEAKEVMQWTLDHTRKPVVGLLPHAIYNGALLAVTVNPDEHAREAAKMAIAILAGKRAGDIPIKINQDGYVMVNLKDKAHIALDATIDIDQIADLVIR